MGLSKPAEAGDAAASAPAERFDEAAAYAREQAAANNSAGPATAPPTGTPASTTPAATSAPAAAAAASGTTPPASHAPPQAHQPQQQQQQPPPSRGQWANPGNPSQPVQGIPVRGPTQQPAPQHVIIGYALVTPQDDCSCDLRIEGWLVVLVLLLTIPCFAWIPCMIPDCFQPYQVPIYGPPGSYPVPIATPYYV